MGLVLFTLLPWLSLHGDVTTSDGSVLRLALAAGLVSPRHGSGCRMILLTHARCWRGWVFVLLSQPTAVIVHCKGPRTRPSH
jgi:hypothetical protein